MVTMSTVSPGSKDFKDEVSRLIGLLNKALIGNDPTEVRSAASELWKIKAEVQLTATRDYNLGDSKTGPPIGINVTLQRRGEDRGNIRLLVLRTMTIWQLKHLMFRDYKMPVNVQRWIYQRQFPEDGVTLESLDVKDGDFLGLYIMSPKFANESPLTPSLSDMPMLEERLVTAAGDGIGSADAAPAAAAALFAPVLEVEPEQEEVKWQCGQCTLFNEATRPSCEMCGGDRPADFEVPADYQPSAAEARRMEEEEMMTTLFVQTQEKEREAHQAYVVGNLELLAQKDEQNYVGNPEDFECAVCFEEVEPGAGVLLRNCLHQFCVECLRETVRNSEGAEVKCPFTDGNYECDQVLQHREIGAVVSKEDYEKYLGRSVRIAEGQEMNSFHCKTPNCQGWCIYEDEVNFFTCPICHHVNCLTCKVIHEGMNCKQYQEDLTRRAEIDTELKATMDGIKAMLDRGEAMNCPGCGVLLQKKEGCDWMRCSMCMTELCWATRGRRWGPRGNGDTSGGCRCGLNGRACTPRCQNCH